MRALENSPVAQLVEQAAVNRWVVGSSPTRGANSPFFLFGFHLGALPIQFSAVERWGPIRMRCAWPKQWTFEKRAPRPWRILALTLLIILPATVGRAQDVWVKSKEVNLTLRTGAGTQYRIIGGLKTGDSVKIVSRGDGWTQVQTADGKEGWISAGFLQPEPPASVALELLKRETAALRNELATLTKDATGLQSTNEKLVTQDGDQRSEIDRLTRENYELRAGARWPEWFTGGGIVLLGMALGAVLSRNSGRRPKRIRL